MVCKDTNFVPKDNIFEFLECFHDGKQLFFCRRVPHLCGIEFPTVEGYWFIILADDRTQLEVACIGMYVKKFVKIRI